MCRSMHPTSPAEIVYALDGVCPYDKDLAGPALEEEGLLVDLTVKLQQPRPLGLVCGPEKDDSQH
jgi:hypothetical protein